jgi:hypothetical protein
MLQTFQIVDQSITVCGWHVNDAVLGGLGLSAMPKHGFQQ